MSTTEQRTGFRLPWSSDSRAPAAEDVAGEAPPESDDPAVADTDATPTASVASEEDTEEMTWPEVDRRVRQIGRRSTDHDPNPATVDEIVTRLKQGASRRSNPLMAELAKAMHVAAEAARAETLERLAADAAARIEAIHSGASEEAAALKARADADVASVRDWSKSELARIREETERRIADRRAELEKEADSHAAQIERRIERVRRTVSGFEAEMAAFFETLLSEEDPTRVALLAEQLPEPPSLEIDDDYADAYEAVEAVAFDPAEDILIGESSEIATASGEETEVEPEAATAAVETVETTEAAEAAEAAETAETLETPEAAATAEAATAGAATAGAATAGAATAEAATAEAAEPEAMLTAEGAAAAEAEAAAAEAEAAAAIDAEAPAEPTEPSPKIDSMAEEAIAARLSGRHEPFAEPATARTELVVTGLVSVASIAGFKREMARAAGVHAVGVTSGPDGEFVFAVTHATNANLKTAVAGLAAFETSVTGEADGVLRVAARERQPQA